MFVLRTRIKERFTYIQMEVCMLIVRLVGIGSRRIYLVG
jgi:hypothetical protein